MNILYITKLDGAEWSGPSYSVPNQILYQSRIDNVYWVNLCKAKNNWHELEYYHEVEKSYQFKVKRLSKPFNEPDIVIVEQFYAFTLDNIFKELIQYNIPYVIVPRGEFTEQAQSKKKIKKCVANFVRMKKYIKNATAVQYLTKDECKDSKISDKISAIVLPNGIEGKKLSKKFENLSNNFIVSYIGRLDFYHKGLDMLILACLKLQNMLRNEKCIFKIYGPDRDGKLEYWKSFIQQNGIDDIIYFFDAVTGKEKEKVLLETDVFIMTSRFEGLPMGLIEALAYGIPCFVTSGTNMRKEIETNNCGWGSDGNVNAIAKEIESMLNDRDSLKQKGQCAKKLSDKYNWTSIAEKSHDIYIKLLRGCKKC